MTIPLRQLRWQRRLLFAIAFAAAAAAFLWMTRDLPEDPTGPNVFLVNRNWAEYIQLETKAFASFRVKDYQEAEKHWRAALKLIPQSSRTQYNLACCLAQTERPEEAIQALRKSVELGFRDADHIAQDEDLAPIRSHKEFKAIEADARKPLELEVPSHEPRGQRVDISSSNTVWDERIRSLRSFVTVPEKPISSKCIHGSSEVFSLIRQWYAEGSAAGNHGDLYDNRDELHSSLDTSAFPQIMRTRYGKDAVAAGAHQGEQRWLLFNVPTIGNASVAIQGRDAVINMAYRRCMPHHVRQGSRQIHHLYQQYTKNHLYIYPAAQDYVPGSRGDSFFANTPYAVASKGMSYRDKPFLVAFAATLASFPKETKEKLIEKRLIAPTLQMILRANYIGRLDQQDYLSGSSHPVVFDGNRVDIMGMINMAHSMQPDEIPPQVWLQVESETADRNYFEARGNGERLFSTPSAIARVCRSLDYSREMVVSAERSVDHNGRGLEWHWVILQGDPKRIRLTPSNAANSKMKIQLDYHASTQTAQDNRLRSQRVDIGVFVFNGKHYSAPGIISFYFPRYEQRVYNAEKQIQSVTYSSPLADDPRSEREVVSVRNWRDDYAYERGQLVGWIRNGGTFYQSDGRLQSPVRLLQPKPIPLAIGGKELRKTMANKFMKQGMLQSPHRKRDELLLIGVDYLTTPEGLIPQPRPRGIIMLPR